MADNVTGQEPSSTKQERVDFLKQVIAFAEGNIRAYDTKAQISLAAFVLSANPLITITNTACGPNQARIVLLTTFVVYVTSIVLFGWVLWPVAPPAARLTDGVDTKDLFYVRDPIGVGGSAYVSRLQLLAPEPELTAEAMKLSFIRMVKAQRFKNALVATSIAYLAIAVSFFLIGKCI
jgi:hypothetical protein